MQFFVHPNIQFDIQSSPYTNNIANVAYTDRRAARFKLCLNNFFEYIRLDSLCVERVTPIEHYDSVY